MKTCRKCNRELDDSEFSVNRYRTDGSKILKPDCKECLRKNKGDVRVPRSVPKNIVDVKESKVIFLTVDEIEQLKILLKTIKITEINLDRSNRIPQTINIDKDILKRLKNYSKKNNKSMSDIVNNLLSKMLDILQIN